MIALLITIDWRLVCALTTIIVLCCLALVYAERIALSNIDEFEPMWPDSEALHPDVEAFASVHAIASLTGEARDHA